jgi:hypothetical protein
MHIKDKNIDCCTKTCLRGIMSLVTKNMLRSPREVSGILEFLDRFFINVPNTRFHENLSSGSRAYTSTYGQTDTQTDVKQLICAFRDYAKGPRNILIKCPVK